MATREEAMAEVSAILAEQHAPFKQVLTMTLDGGVFKGTFKNKGNKVFSYEINPNSSGSVLAFAPITGKKRGDSLLRPDYHQDSIEFTDAQLYQVKARWDAMSEGYLRNFETGCC